MLYGWFFQHHVYLDRLADQMAMPAFSGFLRRRDQLALGLTDSQAAILKEAAHDCTRIVEELSEKFSAASGGDPGAPPSRNEKLGRIASAMIAAIETHVADLRPRLGADVCDRMDSYVLRVYGLAGRPAVMGAAPVAQPGVPRPMPAAPAAPMPAPPAMVPAGPSSNLQNGTPFVPRWILYGWYFQRVASLDRIAGQQWIEAFNARALGMTDPQVAILEEAAQGCIGIIEDLSAKFTAASRDSNARLTKNQQLGKIAAAMIEAIEAYEANLRSRLEPDVYDRLDSYVHGLYSLAGFAGLSTAVGVGAPPQPGVPAPMNPGYPGYLPGAPPPRPASVPAPRSPAAPPSPVPAPSLPKPDEDAATVSVVAADPGLPGLLYVGTARGIYANPSGFETWSFCGGPLANASVSALAVGSGTTPAVFAATDSNGVFLSMDRGKTWTAIDKGLTSRSVSSLLFEDDGNSRTLYAGTNAGVFRSTDQGARWEQVSTGMTESRITALGSGAGAVYAGSSDGKLFKTKDAGSNWSEESLVPWSEAVHAIVSAGGTIFVATETGIFKKSDGGRSWSPADAGLPSVNLTALVVSRDNPPALYGVIREGIWKSVDAGASWTMVSEISPSAFAITPGSGSGPAFYAGVRGTILKSTDAGKSWKTTALKRPAAP